MAPRARRMGPYYVPDAGSLEVQGIRSAPRCARKAQQSADFSRDRPAEGNGSYFLHP